MAKKTESLGNCFICGVELGKIKMKNHVIREHAGAGNEKALLLRAEGAWNKDYWLLLDIAAGASLKDLDRFLRRIWLECCGHMSLFFDGSRHKAAMTRKISDFRPGDKLEYEYDMGDATGLLITFIGETSRPEQKNKARLLARNTPPQYACAKCGKSAAHIYNDYSEEPQYYCDECIDALGLNKHLLPVTNSPRMGACAYRGEDDVWTFDPAKVKQAV